MMERTLKLAVFLNVLILVFSMFTGGVLAHGDTGITEGIDSEEDDESEDDEASGSSDPTEVLYGGGDEEITEEEGNEGVERTFLRATDIRADSPAIYLDEDNTLYVTIQNVGGDAGDESYTENITVYIEEIEDLIDEYEGNRRVNRLEEVNGIGPTYAEEIVDRYRTIEKLVEAGASELSEEISGVDLEKAEEIIELVTS